MNKINPYVYIILAVVAVIVFPQGLRMLSGNYSMMGMEAYYHSMHSDTPYEFLLNMVGAGFQPALIALIGFLIPILFYQILRKLKFAKDKSLLIVIMLIASPLFIYLVNVPNNNLLGLFLSILALRLIFTKKGFVFSLLFLIISSLTNLILLFSNLFIIIIFSKKIGKKKFLTIAYSLIFVFIFSRLPLFKNYEILSIGNFFVDNFTDFGAIIGIGTFSFMLAIVGLISSWRSKKKFSYVYIFAAILILASIYINAQIKVYLVFFIAFFAGLGFYTIINLKWKLNIIRFLSIMIIISGITFSAISYANRLSDIQPDKNLVDSLIWLNSVPYGKVLSAHKYGYIIENIADKPVQLESMGQLDYHAFYTNNLDNAIKSLKNDKIRYILVTKEMVNGLVWKDENSGLIRLLKNKENFKLIYSSPEVRIWELKRSPKVSD